MKKIYPLFLALIGFTATSAFATSYTINISGVTYDPDLLEVVVGDEITIEATGNHPLAEVTESTWNADGSTPMPSGFGVKTANYTFTVTASGSIYYVCQAHVGAGMKGRINVSMSTGITGAASVTGLRVFPSIVSNGVFNVSAETDVLQGATVELYSTNGQLMESFLFTSESAVLRTNLATGTYVAVIRKRNEAILRQRMVFIGEQ